MNIFFKVYNKLLCKSYDASIEFIDKSAVLFTEIK